MSKVIQASEASIAMIIDGKIVRSMWPSARTRRPEPSPPRFDGGDGGDEDDGGTAPIMWLRACMDRGGIDTTALLRSDGYHFTFCTGMGAIRARRDTLPNHDPGDEDRWTEITHAELIMSILAGGAR